MPSTGELSESRMETLEAIDAGWCPVWDAGWQRAYRLCQAHVRARGPLPQAAGAVIVQGEDLGAWATAQRAGWERLMSAQQYLPETLGPEPAPAGVEAARPVGRREAARAVNLAAARQYSEREGHLQVPRKTVEVLPDETTVKLHAVVDNTRPATDKLTNEQRAAWTAPSMHRERSGAGQTEGAGHHLVVTGPPSTSGPGASHGGGAGQDVRHLIGGAEQQGGLLRVGVRALPAGAEAEQGQHTLEYGPQVCDVQLTGSGGGGQNIHARSPVRLLPDHAPRMRWVLGRTRNVP
nr:hypothetical protein StreXyl84_63470 [Streptomyces sp. Xyl84]